MVPEDFIPVVVSGYWVFYNAMLVSFLRCYQFPIYSIIPFYVRIGEVLPSRWAWLIVPPVGATQPARRGRSERIFAGPTANTYLVLSRSRCSPAGLDNFYYSGFN